MNGDLYIPVLKECHAGTYRSIAPIAAMNFYSNNATITILGELQKSIHASAEIRFIHIDSHTQPLQFCNYAITDPSSASTRPLQLQACA